MRIFCAMCLCQALLGSCMTLVQKRSVRTSCPKSLCPDLCTKILSYHLCKISVCGSPVQNFSVRMSASGSCRTTCAKSLCADLLSKISLSRCLHQDPVKPFVQDLCIRFSYAYFCVRISASRSCMTTCARSLCEDLLCQVHKISQAESWRST